MASGSEPRSLCVGASLFVPRGFAPVRFAAPKSRSPDYEQWQFEWVPPFALDKPGTVYLLKTADGITLDIMTDQLAAVTLADDIGGYVTPWAA